MVLVDGPVQQKQIFSFREELTLFLRKHLNNFSITVDSALKESQSKERKAYTSVEKFKMMSELNPALLKLKELLHLEVGH